MATSFSTTTVVGGGITATVIETFIGGSLVDPSGTPAAASTPPAPTTVVQVTAADGSTSSQTVTGVIISTSVPGAASASVSTSYQLPPNIVTSASSSSVAQTSSSGPSSAPATTQAGASTAGVHSGLALDPTSSFPTPSSTGGTAAPATSTAASPSAAPSSGSNVGLEAGIGVLGGLLALALVAIAVLLAKRRRGSSRGRDSALSDMEGARSRTTEKDILLRDAQRSLMANSGPGAAPVLDDKYVASQFARLSQEVNDWVLAHFKHMTPHLHNLPSDVRQALSQQPNWPRLLQDSRGRFLILRGVVADYLYEAFHTGDINGLGETMRMKNHLPENIPFHEQSRWRSSTVALMEQDPGFRGRQAAAVQGLAEKIDATTSTLAGLDVSDARLRQLNRIVQLAADTALELSRQRVDFYLFAPRESSFDPAKMTDVLQEAHEEDIGGSEVLSVVFPAVLRHGAVSGSEFDQVNVISKAQVLVNHEGRAI